MLRGNQARALSTRAADFAYQPALDGVRAVAVTMVLLFHQGWLGGGYVGVSVFFTLSGYLITSLALAEHDRTGRLDVGAFYVRRLRRLLPASLVCLLGIVVLARWALFDAVADLRRDLWGALAQVYNWVALSDGQAYADLVGGGDGPLSLVEHYWSLAIEEQFYWVWPLILLGVLRRGRRGRLAIVVALTVVAAAAAPLIASAWGPEVAYWATPARLGEILVGALVAVVFHTWRAVALPAASAWLGVAGLVVVVWASVTWPSGSGPAYQGWLPVFGLASAALVIGLQVPSALRRVLALRPLVELGVISYGVYLYHWPVYVVLDADRTGLAPAPLFAVRIALTLALATMSFRLLEQPIRRGRARRLWAPIAAAVACSSVVIVVAVVPIDSTPYWMEASADAGAATLAPVDSIVELAAIGPTTTMPRPVTTIAPAATFPATTVPASTTIALSTVAPTTAAPPPPVPSVPPFPTTLSRPVRIMLVGDSTAMATGQGMVAWAAEHPESAHVAVVATPGCGFIRDGIIPTDEDDGFRAACAKLRDARIPATMAELQPDVVVGMVTMRDIEDRVWDDAEGPIGPVDDRFMARLVADYDVATQQFLAGGAARVVWVLAPIPAVPFQGDAAKVLDPVRYARYAAGLAEVVARHAGRAAIVDLAGWLAAQPAMPDRPDGLHWSVEASTALSAEFLGPAVVAATLA